MKPSVRIAIKGTVLIMVAVILTLVMIRSIFLIWQMPNDTMLPLIRSNDIVVATRWFQSGALRSGDLVVVEVPTPVGNFPTVREIHQQSNTPPGEFYVEAINTNGVDSRQCGALPAKNIKGKVLKIIRCEQNL